MCLLTRDPVGIGKGETKKRRGIKMTSTTPAVSRVNSALNGKTQRLRMESPDRSGQRIEASLQNCILRNIKCYQLLMSTIYVNDDLLELVSGTYYIHDSQITRFENYQLDHKVCIDILFRSVARASSKDQLLKIRFFDVIEFGFYWNNKHTFYNVECYKFLKTDEGYCLSLDPDETLMDQPSIEDNDFILCGHVEGSLA